MDSIWHIRQCDSNLTDTGPATRDLDHMIGFIKAVLMFALVLFAIGTVCAFISSWRQGVLRRDWEWIRTGLEAVYLKIKNFAQRIFR